MNKRLNSNWLRLSLLLLFAALGTALAPLDCLAQGTAATMKLRTRPLGSKPNGKAAHAPHHASKAKVADSEVTVYGMQVYDTSWTSYLYGMYKYPATSDIAFTPILTGRTMIANGGGVAVGDDYYYMYYESDGDGNYVNSLIHYDINTWKKVDTKEVPLNCAATDLTYDPTTGNVYGIFLSDNYSGFVFGRLDIQRGVRTAIAALSQSFSTLAANSAGDIYGVGEDGNLYQFDKQTGEPSYIGATGYIPDTYNQSATFDWADDVMYWSANMDDGTCGLYTIDTETGAASLVGLFPNSNEVVGTFIPYTTIADDAPSEATNLTASFANGSTTGRLAFTAPTTTYGGGNLTGSLDYKVYVNDVETATGKVDAGAKCDVSLTAPTGETTFKVTLSNAKGTSPYASLTLYIGNDAPKAVGNLTLKKEGDKALLTWTAPDGGTHDGYVNPAAITYDVVRHPDGKTIATGLAATSLQDAPTTDERQSVYYTVTPIYASQRGASAESNHVAFGESRGIPYTQNFDDANSLDLFTIVDGYDDQCTWTYNAGAACAECVFSKVNPKDEWLITPPLRLKADRLYSLAYTANSLDQYQPESLEVKLGVEASVESLTQTLVENAAVGYDGEGNARAAGTTFRVAADGTYHIGFHCTNEEYAYYLQLDNINLTEGLLLAAPDSVSNLVCTPAANGALSATVAFTLPQTNIGGDKLADIDKVEVSVNGTVKATLEAPAVGSYQSVSVETAKGTNAISVTAYNKAGKGASATASVFTGEDTPLPPAKAEVRMVDGKQVITWSPATIGQHGGYVNTAKTTYTIGRNLHEYGRVDVVAKDLTDTTFTTAYDGGTSQDYISYYVYVNKDGQQTTDYTATNLLATGGKDYALPFVESFAGGKRHYTPWVSTNNGGMWSEFEYDPDWDEAEPQDDDEGFAAFEPLRRGSSSHFQTGRISMVGSVRPTLSLWYYQTSSTNSFDVCVNPDQSGWVKLTTIDLATGGAEGWKQVSIPLSDYKDCTNVCLGFDAVGNDLAMVYIDNIVLADSLDNNLSAQFAATPTKARADRRGEFKVAVTNCGVKESGDYRVELLRDGVVVDKVEGCNLEALAIDTCVLSDIIGLDAASVVSYQAKVVMEGDENASNDTTLTVALATVIPTPAPVTALTGNVEADGVKLAWTKPSTNGWEAETEGFEGYTPFTISDFGDWTMVDVEGSSATYGISASSELLVEYPNYASAMAYQVFNPSLAAITASNWQAHSGQQMLAAFCDYDDQNDDWLMSPELSGCKQTITFYAASASNYYGDETFEVLASTTDRSISSFSKVYEASVPMKWQEVSVELPEGSRYFALRHTTEDGFCFLVDDVTYIPSNGGGSLLTLTGYNVYRDGQRLNASPVADCAFTDNTADGKGHTYTVKAVYTQGESEGAELTLASTSAIDTPNAASTFSIAAPRGQLLLTANASQSVAIYTASGQKAWQGYIAGGQQQAVQVAPGTYMVKCGEQVKKVLVP